MIINLVVMQPIDLCNLNCSYCYLPGRKNPKLMSDGILEASYKAIFNSRMVNPIHDKETLKIVWHSGEPLLAGLPFYKRAKEIEARHNINKIPVAWDIQTNATRINQEWCDFIIENNITVGVSIDGPQFIHDQCRVNWNGKGSHTLAMRGVELLRKNNIPLYAICVLTKNSLDYPETMFNFFKEMGFDTVCFNVDEQEGHNRQSTLGISDGDASVVDQYRHFMSSIYDLWSQGNRKINIREFSRVISTLKFRKQFGFSPYLPSAESLAFHIVAITKDGHISTFSPELSGGTANNALQFMIGNVLNINSLDALVENVNFQSQLASVNQGLEKCKANCEYFSVCGGGSPSNKFYEHGTFNTTETSFCKLNQKVLYDVVFNKLQMQG